MAVRGIRRPAHGAQATVAGSNPMQRECAGVAVFRQAQRWLGRQRASWTGRPEEGGSKWVGVIERVSALHVVHMDMASWMVAFGVGFGFYVHALGTPVHTHTFIDAHTHTHTWQWCIYKRAMSKKPRGRRHDAGTVARPRPKPKPDALVRLVKYRYEGAGMGWDGIPAMVHG